MGNFGIFVVLCISWRLGVEAQQLKTVIAGEAVEFSCSLSESLPSGDVFWRIQWSGSSTPIDIDAESSVPVSGTEFSNNHGDYRTIYRSERRLTFTHYCTLIIENIQLSDAGQFSCKHVGNFRDRGIFSEHELRVLPRPPNGQLPRCSFTTTSVSSNSPQEDMIELNCEFSGGNPPARLVWYSQGMQLSPINENSNDVPYRLKPADNGAEFSCHAMSPALSETSYCHVTPLEIQPTISLEPARVEATVGADVTFICTGQGIPSISRIDWHINGALQESISTRGVVHAYPDQPHRSYLSIHDLQENENDMHVMCEVATATGLTADSLARITMLSSNIPTEAKSSTTSNEVITERTSKRLTEILKTETTGLTKAFDSMNSSKTTYTKSAHNFATVDTQTTLGIKGDKIGAKITNEDQKPSAKSKKSNIPALATGIALIFFFIIVIIVVVVKRRRSRSRKEMQRLPTEPVDLPVSNNPLCSLNEYANQMYEGTILNTSATKSSENFYQAAPVVDEDPQKTWSTHESCGIWQDDKNHHYENTAIGSPFPTFAKHTASAESVERNDSDHFIYDVVEK